MCPACHGLLVATRLRCEACDTAVEGRFPLGLTGLTGDEQAFARAFLLARGNLRELERTLGMGYAALRGRLDALVSRLEAVLTGETDMQGTEDGERETGGSWAVLEALEAGEIDPAEAVRRLRGGNGRR